MSTITSLSESAHGRIARFVRLCVNDSTLRHHLKPLKQLGVIDAGVLLPGFSNIHTRHYTLGVARAILSAAYASDREEGIAIFFRLGQIANACNVVINWEEDVQTTEYAALAVIHSFLRDSAGWWLVANGEQPIG